MQTQLGQPQKMQIKSSQLTVLVNSISSPPPRKILETLRTVHFFIFPHPYMMSKIHKKQNCVILSGMDLP